MARSLRLSDHPYKGPEWGRGIDSLADPVYVHSSVNGLKEGFKELKDAVGNDDPMAAAQCIAVLESRMLSAREKLQGIKQQLPAEAKAAIAAFEARQYGDTQGLPSMEMIEVESALDRALATESSPAVAMALQDIRARLGQAADPLGSTTGTDTAA